jgi:RNAse (barnase) inhibitor barstar
MKIDNIYSFSKNPRYNYGRSTLTCFIGCDITTKEELFSKIALSLDFPGYFGRNWSALEDCLCGFERIRHRLIIIAHDKLMLDVQTAEIYIGALIKPTMIWRKYKNEHILIPIFHLVDKQTVMDTLYNKEMECFNHFNKEFFPEG